MTDECNHVVAYLSYTIFGLPGSPIPRAFEADYYDPVTLRETPELDKGAVALSPNQSILYGREEVDRLLVFENVQINGITPLLVCPICHKRLVPEVTAEVLEWIREDDTK